MQSPRGGLCVLAGATGPHHALLASLASLARVQKVARIVIPNVAGRPVLRVIASVERNAWTK